MLVCVADVAKLVDAPDLGSGVVTREGSSPFIRTKHSKAKFVQIILFLMPSRPF